MKMSDHRTDSSIFALVAAFTSGFDVFKKLRRRRKKREELAPAKEENRLSKSLSRAPMDIQESYHKGYSIQGERFREGDSKAHASLAAVLLKLNNGLVSIIQSFLHGGKRGSDLDYERLTALSECSRLEAIDALSQLSFRLSQSSISLLRSPAVSEKASSKKTVKRKDLYGDGNTAIIRRMQVSNGSTPQLALIKPRNKRNSSESRPKSRATSPKAPPTPPSLFEEIPSPKAHRKLSSNKSTSDLNYQFNHGLPSPPPTPPDFSPQLAHQRPRTSGGRDPLEDLRRRQHKSTPSTYTFASDSTKLGEIPMDRWNTPYDFAEMAKLNAEAALKPRTQTSSTTKQKRGFFSRFKRGNSDTS